MSYSHFTHEQRQELQELLNLGLKCKEIADKLNLDPTSISREIKRNREDKGRRYGYNSPSTLCENFKSCTTQNLCQNCYNKICSTCTRRDCTKLCSRFKKQECIRITRFPYVCNGCTKRTSCRMERCLYSAQVAHAKALDNAREPRKGVDLSGAQLVNLDSLVTPLMKKGQSLNQIYLSHENEIPCCLKSLYNHVNCAEIGPGRMYLIDAVCRKPRKKSSLKTPKYAPRKSLSNRRWQDYLALDEDFSDGRWEMDCVMGSTSGKCLLTLLHRPTRFQLALLLEEHTSQQVVLALRLVRSALGVRAAEIMYLVITDNGPEFFDAEGIEEALGCKLYYCESYSSWQKGAAESNHKYYRRIIEKGNSMNHLTKSLCSKTMSHVNSTPRACLGGLSPYEAISPLVGQSFFEAFGIEFIPRDEVVLLPSLLSQ